MGQLLSRTDKAIQVEPPTAAWPEHTPQQPGWKGRLYKYVPAFESLRHYSWPALGNDVIAGLTVATVAVPQAMAYATLAGVAPQYGLYTAIVMTGVGALLDSSRQLINGPTNAISIALLSALAVVPEGDKIPAAVLLAFLVGVTQLGIAFLRLGDLTRYVSHSVIVGFTLGASTLLVLDQMKNLLGLESRGHPESHFLTRFWLSVTTGGSIHWPTFLIGLATIAIVVGVRKLNDIRRKRGARFPIPQHLVGVVLMAALVWGFSLHERFSVKIVGAIPAELPSFQLPELKWDQVRLLSGNAFAIALLGLLEAIAMAKAIASRTGQRLDINQQCLSEGAANLAGSFFQCIPGSGSLTRSAVNQQSGAVSQWSGVVAALAVAVMVLLLGPLAQYIPRAALAGLLMLAAFRMIDFEQVVFHLRATRFDAGVMLATALAAVAISVEFCILIGVFCSFVLYMPRAAQVQMTRFTLTQGQRIRAHSAGDPPCDRLLIFGLEGELFFGAEPELQKYLSTMTQTARGGARVLVLILRQARNPDAAFLGLLQSFHKRLQRQGVVLILCGVLPDLSKALAYTGFDAELGTSRLFCNQATHDASVRDAVRLAYELLGEEMCLACPRRQAGASTAVLDYEI